jgi:hypothetical protein
MSNVGFDRLIRKEVSLGAIREKQPPQDHIGLTQIAPFLDVATDDAIFDYIAGGFQDGLAPARAEDAEAELAQKDELLYGQGRASVIDWALKDKYTASDISRYREDLFIQQQLRGVDAGNLPLNFTGRQVDGFQQRLAREDTRRRRFLDNRIEWLIMSAIDQGKISYNDGKIKWTVDFGRPADQQAQAPASGLYNGTDHDPIGDFQAVSQEMFDKYGVRPKRVIASRKLLNTFWRSDRFIARTGLVVGGTPSSPIDMNYLVSGWDQDAAVRIVEQAVGMQFIEYDSVYRTRNVGSTQWVNNRFTDEDTFYFLPSPGVENTGYLGEIDDTEVGFAKTLTAPHPEGNWSSGYYEWEDETRDPWMHVRGSGIKAFPVFPYMELTYSMKAL